MATDRNRGNSLISWIISDSGKCYEKKVIGCVAGTILAKHVQNKGKTFPGRGKTSAKALRQECVVYESCERRAGMAESGRELDSSLGRRKRTGSERAL